MDLQRELDNQDDSQPPIKHRRSNSTASSTEDDEEVKSQRMVDERFETLVNENMDLQRELDNQDDSQPPIKHRRSNSTASSTEDDEEVKSQRMVDERFETLVNENMDLQRELDNQDDSQPPIKHRRSNSTASSTEDDEEVKSQRMVDERFETLVNENMDLQRELDNQDDSQPPIKRRRNNSSVSSTEEDEEVKSQRMVDERFETLVNENMDLQKELDNQDDSQLPIKRRRSNSSASSTEDDEEVKSQRMVDDRLETLVNEITTSVKVSIITLEGNCLSERQRKLNAAVNEAYKKEISLVEVLSSGEQTDLDNIYKIDLASKYRNVDYIIENLKSTDSLCVNRALKAHWLFTDDQYSHVINPTYVYTVLQPLMSDKAFNKLLSQVAYHLKDEKRCEDFYMHCREVNDERYMKKFFLNCSVDFIKERISKDDLHLCPKYLSLLCRKSFEIMIVYVDKQSRYKINQQHLKEFKYVMDDHGEFYLDLLQDNVVNNCVSFRLGQRVTREILRNHKERIFQRPLLYLNLLHYKQLIHALSHDDIRELASLVTSRHNFWDNSWLKILLSLLPSGNRYKFIKSLYERDHPGEVFEMKIEFSTYKWYEYMSKMDREIWALKHIAQLNEYLGKLYQWYKFVGFNKSIVELKKLLQVEPNASERETMFEILISACNEHESNLIKLLKYFRFRHINETILFKQQIIGKIMNERNIYECSNEVWDELNEILLSMRIYEDVNDCTYGFKKNAITQAMVHHIIYDKPITEKMLKLYEKCYSMLSIAITSPRKKKVFEFVQNWIFTTKINGEKLQRSKCLARVVRWTVELINVCKTFEYPPQPELIELIRKIRNCNPNNFSAIVFHDEAYKEYFQDEIQPPASAPKLTEVICLQKLKKDITLLSSCKDQFTENIQNNEMRYKRFLSKIRIYFDNDLAPEWRKYFFGEFKKSHKDSRGCASVVFGLTILLPGAECEQLIKEYQPEKAKLMWSNTDPCLVHIQTNIVKFMHLVRPTVNHEYLTSYAKGIFRQHSLPPIVSLSRQLPIENCRELIKKLMLATTTIMMLNQGIRLAFKKLSTDELVDLFNKLWVKTQNATMQSCLHTLLIKAENDEKRFSIWNLLSIVLTQLHGNEYLTNIVDPRKRTLSQVGMSVRPQYCTAYWHLLQSVPISEQIWSYRETILHEMCRENMINFLEENFLKDIMFNFLEFKRNKHRTKKLPEHYISAVWKLIATFVVCCETKDIAERRKEVFMKVLQYFFSRWNNTNGYFYRFLVLLISNAQAVLNENKFYNPLHLFEYISDEVSERWTQRQYYGHRLWLKFIVLLIKSLHETEEYKPESFMERCKLWAEIFGKHCIELMRNETAEHYPRLPQIFRHNFIKFIDNESHGPYGYDKANFYISVSKSFLKEHKDLDCYILAVECLVKVDPVISENFEARSMLDSIRAKFIPELNHYIETKVEAQRNPFK